MKTDTWTVEGGVPLRGEVRLSGAKNSITKLMVASMLTKEPCIFHNVPSIGDSQITRAICEALGAEFQESPRVPCTYKPHGCAALRYHWRSAPIIAWRL